MSTIGGSKPLIVAVLVYTSAAAKSVPRAAWYAGDIAQAVMIAAQKQGFAVMEIADTQIDLVGASVPQREFSPGSRIVIPVIKKDALSQLLTRLSVAAFESSTNHITNPASSAIEMVSCAGDEATIPETPTGRSPWDNLRVGMVVLAAQYSDKGVPDEGWWESVIVAVASDIFTLRFRDYPRDPLIKRKRTEIGLMPPNDQ